MGDEKKNEKITNGDGHVLTEAELRRQAAFVQMTVRRSISCFRTGIRLQNSRFLMEDF